MFCLTVFIPGCWRYLHWVSILPSSSIEHCTSILLRVQGAVWPDCGGSPLTSATPPSQVLPASYLGQHKILLLVIETVLKLLMWQVTFYFCFWIFCFSIFIQLPLNKYNILDEDRCLFCLRWFSVYFCILFTKPCLLIISFEDWVREAWYVLNKVLQSTIWLQS